MSAKLVAEEGMLKGLVLNLEEGEEWTIGRDPDESQIVLEDPSVSRKHMICRKTAEGFFVKNISETNPVLLNDSPLANEEPLRHGDMVRIGEGVYRFYEEAAATIEEEESTEEEEEEHDTLFEEGDEENEKDVLAEVDFDLQDTSPWMLKVVSGPNNGAQFAMESGTSYVVGTDPSASDIVFNDVSVSRQHARISIDEDNNLSIEDLNSRNGTLVDSQAIEGRQTLKPNALVSVGTSSFVIYDRESERETVISPLLPQIVKILQQEEKKEELEEEKVPEQEDEGYKEETLVGEEEQKPPPLSRRILVSLLIGLFLIVGFGTIALFLPERIAKPDYNAENTLTQIISPYENIKYLYNPASQRLLLTGHVLTSVDRDQLLHNLRILPFIAKIDDNIIVDENIWQETNQVLAKNPNWRGVSIHSPTAGRFVLTGYLQTRKQADELNDYLSHNFNYLELLEKSVFVEENIMNEILVLLKEQGFNAVEPKVLNGEVILTGDIPYGDRPAMNEILDEVGKIPGVREVKPFISELPPTETLVNITDKYSITGSLEQGDGKISVVINGQLLSEGNVLNGMVITKIDRSMILLEKGGVKYRIDYNK